ncbi:MAG: hypothetical protein R6V13_13075 [Anaerolineae bacterium]
MKSRSPTQERQALYALLGDFPPLRRPIAAEKIKTETRDGYGDRS